MNLQDLFNRAADALQDEIDTLRQMPAHLSLSDGRRVANRSDEFHYRFEGAGGSLRFAEEITAWVDGEGEKVSGQERRVGGGGRTGRMEGAVGGGSEVEDAQDDEEEEASGERVEVVSIEGSVVVLKTQRAHGERIGRIDLEWENDFVERRTLEEIQAVRRKPESRARALRLFETMEGGAWDGESEEDGDGEQDWSVEYDPDGGEPYEEETTVYRLDDDPRRGGGSRNAADRREVSWMGESAGEGSRGAYGAAVRDDGRRNAGQRRAMELAMEAPCLYLWGPPGTGKTATLGFITANLLRSGMSVLFASNTHRAVDVGLLSILDALETIGSRIRPERLSRYGDPVLEDERLMEHAFSIQVEERRQSRRSRVAEHVEWLERAQAFESELGLDPGVWEQPAWAVRKQVDAGVRPEEFFLVHQSLERLGGRREVEEHVAQAASVNERSEFRSRSLIAATLAKVCTSELFRQRTFDAVVVDEASMASLPTLLVLASHAATRIIVAGDPMQLPPISVASREESREFMEQDVFTFVSGAATPADLFRWHDRHPDRTAFFEIQYRMRDRLARVISEVFYEGRLRSAPEPADEVEEPPLGTVEPGRPAAIPAGKGRAQARGGVAGRPEPPACRIVDTSPLQPWIELERRDRSFRPVNTVHMSQVSRIVSGLLARGLREHEIGVIVPFRHSVTQLGRHLTRDGFREVETGTIHTFQGREKEVIIFDTVMSGEKAHARSVPRHYTVRPLDETKNTNPIHVPRLLNVACTRCRRELYILADMGHIRRRYANKFLGKLLQRLSEA